MAFCLLFVSSALAQESTNDPLSKDAFLKAWEDHQKSLPSTVVFEKTDIPGVYNFETTLFPYKGQIKVLNVVIDKDLDFYDGYDLRDENFTIGTAEIELVGVDEHFVKKYPRSTDLWFNQNHLYFVDDVGRWMSANAWYDYDAAQSDANAQGCYADGEKTFYQKYKNLFDVLIIFAIVFLLFVPFVRKSGKTQKQYIEKYDAVTSQSLAMQKEHIALMKELLAKIDKDKT